MNLFTVSFNKYYVIYSRPGFLKEADSTRDSDMLLKLQGCMSPFNEEMGRVGGELL